MVVELDQNIRTCDCVGNWSEEDRLLVEVHKLGRFINRKMKNTVYALHVQLFDEIMSDSTPRWVILSLLFSIAMQSITTYIFTLYF